MSGAGFTPFDVITAIADVAEHNAALAGVGACEMAGMIVSGLSAHPELVDKFMANPSGTLIDDFEKLLWSEGRLSWVTASGHIMTPEAYREIKAGRGPGQLQKCYGLPRPGLVGENGPELVLPPKPIDPK